MNYSEQKKKPSKPLTIVVVVVAIILAFCGLAVFMSRGGLTIFIGAPTTSKFKDYLSEKYPNEGEFTFVDGNCSEFFNVGICTKKFHSEKYGKNFDVVYHKHGGELSDAGSFSDELLELIDEDGEED